MELEEKEQKSSWVSHIANELRKGIISAPEIKEMQDSLLKEKEENNAQEGQESINEDSRQADRQECSEDLHEEERCSQTE